MAGPRTAPKPWKASNALAFSGEALGTVAQLVLIGIGATVIWGADDHATEMRLRLLWCVVATAYLVSTMAALNIMARGDRADPHPIKVLVGHPVSRVISTLVTFSASLIGVTGALDLIAGLSMQTHDPVTELTAMWMMMLAWALFNWGYARVYFSRFYRESTPPLEFPGTTEPRLVDFVYVAFTNATTFSVSDVRVTSSRMRWTLVWHTTLAFFFNALILALVLNVVTSGDILTELFS